MNITGNVVRLTRCENVPGFTTLFAAALAEAGCPYYPEYRVYEEYAAFGQTRFVCQVHVIQDDYAGGKFENNVGRGMGVTIEQAVQEAAYTGLVTYRDHNPYLSSPESLFRNFPAQRDYTVGSSVARYTPADANAEPKYRALVDLVQALDHRARMWRDLFMASDMSLYETLMEAEDGVEMGVLDESILTPTSIALPAFMDCPPVGGTIPRPGRLIPPPVSVHRRQREPQPPSARLFPTPWVPLPSDIGGYF